jgi:hypothetical protein
MEICSASHDFVQIDRREGERTFYEHGIGRYATEQKAHDVKQHWVVMKCVCAIVLDNDTRRKTVGCPT